jgi:flagellin-specific chaperone FliS
MNYKQKLMDKARTCLTNLGTRASRAMARNDISTFNESITKAQGIILLLDELNLDSKSFKFYFDDAYEAHLQAI